MATNALSISSRIAGSSMVAGNVYDLLSAIFCMVPRRILPDHVFGRRLTTVAAVAPYDTLGLGCRTRGMNIEGVCGKYWNTFMGLCLGHHIIPVQIPALYHGGRLLRTLKDDAAIRLGLYHVDGLIQHGFVGNAPGKLYATGCTTTLGCASCMRVANSLGAKPPKTSE
jgi:hypothetical protein